jgi:hypothetical protein
VRHEGLRATDVARGAEGEARVIVAVRGTGVEVAAIGWVVGSPEGVVGPSTFATRVVRPPCGAARPPGRVTKPLWWVVGPPGGMVEPLASTTGEVRPPAVVTGVPALRLVLMGV